MLEEDSNGGSNNWRHLCDMCRSVPCTLYCRADSAYLCTDCDAHIHAANRMASCHERVWVCEACEWSPAAFLCNADAASLCTACNTDIHSANLLASRHHRVLILPIRSCVYRDPSAELGGPKVGPAGNSDDGVLAQKADENIDGKDDDEAASWLLFNPLKNDDNNQSKNELMFGGEGVDEYLDLVDYNLCQDNKFSTNQCNNQQQNYSVHDQRSYRGDSVVPVQWGERKDQLQHQRKGQLQHQQQTQSFHYNLEYGTSKTTGYSYPAPISHTVPMSSMDLGVVPESTMSDVSISHPRPHKGTIDLFSGPRLQMPPQLMPMDREARVLRYREKRKTRKFEKIIRYASRKAYAEIRPRIKGRFTKRTDVEGEVDQMFSTTLIAETSYGIVPSF